MLKLLLFAFALVAGTVIVHTAGLMLALRPIVRSELSGDTGFWPLSWLVIRTVWRLILIHLVEIAVWALFYWWQKCMPDLSSAFYFSGVTYTTVGYGDLLLPAEWRVLAPIEALTGILMCGLSTGLFFAMASRIYNARTKIAKR